MAIGWVLLGHWRTGALLRTAVKAPSWAWDELKAIIQRTSRNAAEGKSQNATEGVPDSSRVPALWASRRVPSAVALGALSPQIILPESSLAESNRSAVQAALAHEWAHIRHGDLWLLAIERLLLPLLAVHPLFCGCGVAFAWIKAAGRCSRGR
jgi:beta-lactamase regulating signal transducer with metallopeptidase domain